MEHELRAYLECGFVYVLHHILSWRAGSCGCADGLQREPRLGVFVQATVFLPQLHGTPHVRYRDAAAEALQTFELRQNLARPVQFCNHHLLLPADSAEVSLEVYDILGWQVATLVEGDQKAGRYQVWWNGRDQDGDLVSSGRYFYQLQGEGFSEAKSI